MKQTDRIIKNTDLKEVLNIAKEKGYKVYTFESSNKYIEQIFFVNQNGQIGTAHNYHSGITFGSVHVPVRNSGNGSGFRMGGEFEDPNNLDIAFKFAPNWAKNTHTIEKYKNWEDYTTRGTNTILKYFEL